MATVPAVYSRSNGQRRTHPWTLTHSFYAVMGGYLSSDDWPTEPASSSRVSARRAATGRHSDITDVSAADLKDRSKSGGIAKLLLVWQLCVFLVSCAARLRQGLPLTLLEITTISHSLCSLVALAFWWHKPHNVAKATLLNGYTAGRPWRWDFALVGALMPETSGGRVSVMDVPRAVAMLAIAVLYGLPHLLGRAVQFPSSAERTLWNVATYAIISLPLILCSWLWVMQVRLPTYSKAFEKLSGGILAVFASMYAACSLFLLGESLRQVFALPEEAFREPQLARYLPRFS